MFGAIEKRLPEVAQRWIIAATPDAKASKEEKREAYEAIQAWLLENTSWLFPETATAWCEAHHKHCLISPARETTSRSTITDDELEDDCGQRMRVSSASICCTPWSSEGLQAQTAHSDDISNSIVVVERQALGKRKREDVAFGECTSRFPVRDRIGKRLPEHRLVWIMDGPELHGRPTKRMRIQWALINTNTSLWVGPDSDEQVSKDFSKRFHRAGLMEGADMFMASDGERGAEYCALALSQKKMLLKDEVPNVPLDELKTLICPPGQVRILAEWQEVHRNRFQNGMGSMVADLEQHPGSRGAAAVSPYVPVLLKKSCLVQIGPNSKKWKVATAMEHLGMLSFRVHEPCTNACGQSPLAIVLRAYSRRQIIQLCGNGMDVCSTSAWMLYVLSNVVQKPPSVVHRSVSSEWDEEGIQDVAEEDDDEAAPPPPTVPFMWRSTKARPPRGPMCYVASCNQNKKPRSKCCAKHHGARTSAKYIAHHSEDPDAMGAFVRVDADPALLERFLDDFEKLAGGRLRQKRVDWTAWLQ